MMRTDPMPNQHDPVIAAAVSRAMSKGKRRRRRAFLSPFERLMADIAIELQEIRENGETPEP